MYFVKDLIGIVIFGKVNSMEDAVKLGKAHEAEVITIENVEAEGFTVWDEYDNLLAKYVCNPTASVWEQRN